MKKKGRIKNHKKDKAVFAKTAQSKKTINFNPVSYRGGIRL